jgi:hypothetical protein
MLKVSPLCGSANHSTRRAIGPPEVVKLGATRSRRQRSTKSATARWLCKGSPTPLTVTRLTSSPRARTSSSCCHSSSALSGRDSPNAPEAQKVQPTAQPTWLETHRLSPR